MRTGWSGFLSQQNTVFVTGRVEDIIMSAGNRAYNADDVEKTINNYTPQYVHKQRSVVFSTNVHNEERFFVVAEVIEGVSNEALHQWLVGVMEALLKNNALVVYCVMLVQKNSLPTSRDIIDKQQVRRGFLQGSLKPVLVHMNVATVDNLPSQFVHGQGGRFGSMIQMGDVLAGVLGPQGMLLLLVLFCNRRKKKAHLLPMNLVGMSGDTLEPKMLDESSKTNLDIFSSVPEVFEWRNRVFAKRVLFQYIDERGDERKVTCDEFHNRMLRAVHFMIKCGIERGMTVGVMLPPSIDLAVMVLACLFSGVICVPIEPPQYDDLFSTLSVVYHVSLQKILIFSIRLSIHNEWILKMVYTVDFQGCSHWQYFHQQRHQAAAQGERGAPSH